MECVLLLFVCCCCVVVVADVGHGQLIGLASTSKISLSKVRLELCPYLTTMALLTVAPNPVAPIIQVLSETKSSGLYGAAATNGVCVCVCVFST